MIINKHTHPPDQSASYRSIYVTRCLAYQTPRYYKTPSTYTEYKIVNYKHYSLLSSLRLLTYSPPRPLATASRDIYYRARSRAADQTSIRRTCYFFQFSIRICIMQHRLNNSRWFFPTSLGRKSRLINQSSNQHPTTAKRVIRQPGTGLVGSEPSGRTNEFPQTHNQIAQRSLFSRCIRIDD